MYAALIILHVQRLLYINDVPRGGHILRWFIGDFTLTPQYFASSLSVNCHYSQFHRSTSVKLTVVTVY